jgi:hypothetical protein
LRPSEDGVEVEAMTIDRKIWSGAMLLLDLLEDWVAGIGKGVAEVGRHGREDGGSKIH